MVKQAAGQGGVLWLPHVSPYKNSAGRKLGALMAALVTYRNKEQHKLQQTVVCRPLAVENTPQNRYCASPRLHVSLFLFQVTESMMVCGTPSAWTPGIYRSRWPWTVSPPPQLNCGNSWNPEATFIWGVSCFLRHAGSINACLTHPGRKIKGLTVCVPSRLPHDGLQVPHSNLSGVCAAHLHQQAAHESQSRPARIAGKLQWAEVWHLQHKRQVKCFFCFLFYASIH